MIQMNCPLCGHPATLSDEMAGQSVVCPGCNQSFSVPTFGHAGVYVAPGTKQPLTPRQSIAGSSEAVGGSFILRAVGWFVLLLIVVGGVASAAYFVYKAANPDDEGGERLAGNPQPKDPTPADRRGDNDNRKDIAAERGRDKDPPVNHGSEPPASKPNTKDNDVGGALQLVRPRTFLLSREELIEREKQTSPKKEDPAATEKKPEIAKNDTPAPVEPKPVPEPKSERKAEIVFKRVRETTDEELRKQLLLVPEVGLDQQAAANLYAPVRQVLTRTKIAGLEPDLGFRFYAQLALKGNRSDLTALPWRAGLDCHCGKEAAERLHVLSVHLRSCLQASAPRGDVRPDPDNLRSLLLTGTGGSGKGVNSTIRATEWRKPEAIPTLMQLLQAENTAVRAVLIELLSEIPGRDASSALAQRALFDLSAEIREKAVRSLAQRPSEEYLPVLVEGFRWPWPAVADHASEALVALQLKDAIPSLVPLLNEPHPKLPFTVQVKKENVFYIRELVRMNHLSNCMVCHAPSLAKEDLVRGRIPIPGEDPPPLYYQETSGIFVRADITFLRQDFSVVQPVLNPLRWPGHQRYDYLLRARPLNQGEVKLYRQLQKDHKEKLNALYQQREAVLFALRGLTGRDLGSTHQDWVPLLRPILKSDPSKKER